MQLMPVNKDTIGPFLQRVEEISGVALISMVYLRNTEKILVNPITYGILPFRQLRGGGGGGLFGPDPENKVTVNGLI